MESLILHEHHVSDFKTSHEILNRWSQVAATGPDILHEGDIVRVDPQRLRQPPVIELNALLLEEVVFVRLVEHLDAEHDEAAIMSSGQSNVVQVVKARAELRANERVCRRVQLTRDAVGLEAEDARGHVVYVVAPPGNDRVPLDRGARNSGRG